MTLKLDSEWVIEEYKNIQFYDKRLDKRLIEITKAFSEQPGACINQACNGSWSDTKASYDFFKNLKVSKEKIFKAHADQALERARNEPVVLAVNDTTSFNFTNHDSLEGKGLIAASNTHSSGFLFHHTMLFTENGLPLGGIHHDFWTRDGIKEKPRAINAKLPIEKKESYKWIKALKSTHEAEKKAGTQFVHIGDRESDLYDYFLEAHKLNQAFVVRARYNRALNDTHGKLWESLAAKESAGEMVLHIESKGGRPSRDIECEIRFSQVSFKPPVKSKVTSELPLNVVSVREKNCEKPLEWMLITNIFVGDIVKARKITDWYSVRWGIETYHKILKSGCRIESCRLETMERLLVYFSVTSTVAWRIFYMTKINHQNPTAPCTVILSESEWKALYCSKHKSQTPPEQVPTVREAIRWIAGLGGFLGRKGDKEPGIVTIWRGFKRLIDIVEAWKLFSGLHSER